MMKTLLLTPPVRSSVRWEHLLRSVSAIAFAHAHAHAHLVYLQSSIELRLAYSLPVVFPPTSFSALYRPYHDSSYNCFHMLHSEALRGLVLQNDHLVIPQCYYISKMTPRYILLEPVSSGTRYIYKYTQLETWNCALLLRDYYPCVLYSPPHVSDFAHSYSLLSAIHLVDAS